MCWWEAREAAPPSLIRARQLLLPPGLIPQIPVDPRRSTNTPADIHPPAPAAAERDRKSVGPPVSAPELCFHPWAPQTGGQGKVPPGTLIQMNQKGSLGSTFNRWDWLHRLLFWMRHQRLLLFIGAWISSGGWNSFISQEWTNVCLLSPLLCSFVWFSEVPAWIQSTSQCLKPDLCIWMLIYCHTIVRSFSGISQGMEANQFMRVPTSWLSHLSPVRLMFLPLLSKFTLRWGIVFFLLTQPISMASSDDAEETLTPVDFIQLQHYMECKHLQTVSVYVYSSPSAPV